MEWKWLRQPNSVITPLEMRKVWGWGRGADQNTERLRTLCLLETAVTSSWGLTFIPVFLPKVTSFPAFEASSATGLSWQVWLFCQGTDVRVFLVSDRNVLSHWPAAGSWAPNARLEPHCADCWRVIMKTGQKQCQGPGHCTHLGKPSRSSERKEGGCLGGLLS